MLGSAGTPATETTDDATTRVYIDYTAPEGCPTASDFRADVRERAPELRDGSGAARVRRFVTRLEQDASLAIVGTLVIDDPDGSTAVRRVDGTNCRDVARALAFIVAELGRDFRLAGRSSPAIALDGPSHRGPPPRGPGQASAVARARAGSRQPQPESGSWSAEAGVGLDVVHAPAPGLVLAPRAYVQATRGAEPLVALRLSAMVAQSGTIQGRFADGHVRWLAVRAEACRPAWAGLPYGFTACGFFEAGELRGTGWGGDASRVRAAAWLAPGALARAHVRVGKTLLFQADAGAFLPLTRAVFYIDGRPAGMDRDVLHRVPVVGYHMGLGLGTRFP